MGGVGQKVRCVVSWWFNKDEGYAYDVDAARDSTISPAVISASLMKMSGARSTMFCRIPTKKTTMKTVVTPMAVLRELFAALATTYLKASFSPATRPWGWGLSTFRSFPAICRRHTSSSSWLDGASSSENSWCGASTA